MRKNNSYAYCRWQVQRERLHLEDERAPAPARDALPIGKVLQGIMRGLEKPETALLRRWRALWPSIAGAKAALHSIPLSFEAGLLVIAVENSVWRTELARVSPAEWLAKARAACPVEGLRRVVFRVDAESVKKWRAQGESNSSSQDENLVS